MTYARRPPLLPLLLLLASCGGGADETALRAEAERIHAEAWIADTHVDAPYAHAGSEWLASVRHTYDPEQEDDAGQWDIPRMTDGGLDAAFLVVYVGQGTMDEEGYAAAYDRALELLDWIEAMEASSGAAEIAGSAADARRLHAAGRPALFIGMENGYPIAADLTRVEEFYDRGVRYITLAHSSDNAIAASSGTSIEEREDFGLTDFGREVVAEMNRLGIMVDVSHVSDRAFFDVLEMTDVPVILSHSGCRAITDHTRNITDEMLRGLAENGGVIQLVALNSFTRPAGTEARADVDDFMVHLEHAVGVAGIDHVGFGSDFDGGGGIARLEDVTDLVNVTIEMLRRGFSEEDIKKFWGGNLLRVMEAVEAAAGSR